MGKSTENGRHTEPRTATEEVLREFEDAELDVDDDRHQKDHDKEAADALRPSVEIQESVQKDGEKKKPDAEK